MRDTTNAAGSDRTPHVPTTTADRLAAAEANRRHVAARYAQLHQELLRALATEDHLRARLAREVAGVQP